MRQDNFESCICGSKLSYSDCCEPYTTILGIKDINKHTKIETVLIDWMERYSIPIMNSYKEKVGKFVFRVSLYLDIFFDYFYPLGFNKIATNQKLMDESIKAIKHNILLHIVGALSCLSQGLFLQSGTLIRSCLEDSFVLGDLFLNEEQAEKFLNNKYSTNGLISRIKAYLPSYLANWYGFFSANFTHFGPLHPAPYMPRACYADNYIIGAGTENVILATLAFHIILERIYLNNSNESIFWKYNHQHKLEFNNDNKVFTFTDKLRDELFSQFPPDEKRKGYTYSNRRFRLKC